MSKHNSSSMSSSSEIAALLKKTTHYDKDERYMALSDLCELLKKQLSQQESRVVTPNASPTAPMDLHTERDICTTILRLLHDKSNDVQAIAVKTLGVLILTIQNVDLMNEIANSLLDQIIDLQKMELRDIYTAGLRTLIQTCQASMGPRISQRLMARLIEGIRSASSGASTGGEEMMISCLDIIYELIVRFGPTCTPLVQYHEAVLYIGLQLLITPWNHPSSTPVVSTQSVVVKKRAGNVLACLASVLSEPLLQQMVNHLLQPIELLQEQERQLLADTMDTRSLIRTMCAISGTVGHRFSQEQIDRMVPIFLRFTDPQHAVTGDDEETLPMDPQSSSSNALELREACFIGYASFILHCPKEIQTHLPNIIRAALAYMRYDPNYSYGNTNDDDNEEEMADADEEEENEYEDDEEEEEEEDDDDDESWKVRRSAIRTLRAIVDMKVDAAHSYRIRSLWSVSYSTRPGLPERPISMALVEQFKEREENCRVDIVDCFTRLLHNTIEYMHQLAAKDEVNGTGRWQFAATADPMDDDTTIYLQRDYAPALVKACASIIAIKGKDRSKSAALALLATLCKAPGGVGTLPEIQSVFAQVQTFLQGGPEDAQHAVAHHRESSSKALQLDALSLSFSMLANQNHNPIHIRQCLTTEFMTSVCKLLQEQWYKVIAEALRVISQVPKYFVIGFDHEGSDVEKERSSVASQLYTAIEPLLAAHDVDPEIKDGALKACALLLQSLHGSLTVDQTTQLLKLLLDRLMNETTRIAAIKTLIMIAGESTGGCHLDPILADSISTMASFLRLQSRSLKQSALEALEIVIRNHGHKLADREQLFASVVQEVAPLISDKDLHLCHRSL
jgi:cullin-associated NEDD8-dissociated protein 1